MIKPDKYTNLNLSIVNIGGVILKSLYNCSIQKYDDLENHVAATLGDNARVLFVQSLSFLYALGKINYQPTSDSINLV
jgi:hypothetical protein